MPGQVYQVCVTREAMGGLASGRLVRAWMVVGETLQLACAKPPATPHCLACPRL